MQVQPQTSCMYKSLNLSLPGDTSCEKGCNTSLLDRTIMKTTSSITCVQYSLFPGLLMHFIQLLFNEKCISSAGTRTQGFSHPQGVPSVLGYRILLPFLTLSGFMDLELFPTLSLMVWMFSWEVGNVNFNPHRLREAWNSGLPFPD